MEDPNLQCMPKPHHFRALPSSSAGLSSQPAELTPGGRHCVLDANMRAAIVPAPDGFVLLSADFRQVEFRIMAHFSGDETVRAMLADGAADPFVQLAARWRRMAPEAVTRKERDYGE